MFMVILLVTCNYEHQYATLLRLTAVLLMFLVCSLYSQVLQVFVLVMLKCLVKALLLTLSF